VGFWAGLVQAGEFRNSEEFRYRYVSLSQAVLPSGFISFIPSAINNNGQIYGTAFDGSSPPTQYVAVYKHGVVTTLSPGSATTANEKGIVGGFVSVLNQANNVSQNQAALFRGDQMTLIPPQPGESLSSVLDLNDSGTAIVLSFENPSTPPAYLSYKKGQTTLLDFGPTVTAPNRVRINNRGTIALSGIDASGRVSAFRHDTRTGETMQLAPPTTETNDWGAVDINNSGKVLGYSLEVDDTERNGLWDSKGQFKTYFVFPPDNSNNLVTVNLVFNDTDLIVRSVFDFSGAGNSYLLPKPGVLLNLADHVINMPQDQKLSIINDMNNNGDMIGTSLQGDVFLLVRLDEKGHASSESTVAETLAPSEMTNERRTISPAAEDIMQRHIQQLKSGSDRHHDSLENLLLK
jgi:hypothetical protein